MIEISSKRELGKFVLSVQLDEDYIYIYIYYIYIYTIRKKNLKN